MTDCGWMPMMGAGLLFMVLFWVLVISGVVFHTALLGAAE